MKTNGSNLAMLNVPTRWLGSTLSSLALWKNAMWLFGGNVAFGAYQWGIIVIIAKIGTSEMVGQYALGLAICAPVFMFANLNLRSVQATDSRQEFLFGHYLGLRLVTTLLALAAVIGVSWALGYRGEAALAIAMVGLIKVCESLSDILYGFFQQQEQMDRIGGSLIIRSALSALALFLGLHLSGQLGWGLLSLAIVGALTLIWYDSLNCRRVAGATGLGGRLSPAKIRPLWEKSRLFKLARLSLPLGFVWMLISLTFCIPRYFIEHYLGSMELGIFAAMFQLMLTGSIIIMALCQATQPKMAAYLAAGNLPAFRRHLAIILAFAGLIGVIGFFLAATMGEPLLAWIYRPEYAAHLRSFKWMMLAAIFYYTASSLGYAVTAIRTYDALIIPYLAAALLAWTCSWVLIPAYGLLGAAWTLVVVNVFITAMLLLFIIFNLKARGTPLDAR